MKIENDRIRCVCGKWAKPAGLHIEGLSLAGWKCGECGEEYLSPKDSIRLSAYKQIQAKTTQAVVAKVGNSLAIRIRKDVADALGLYAGEKLDLTLPTPNKIELKVA
ncbi:hypothetical protein HY995_04655 [Candidatus Micrarchaeota archaeon]|nr:hypothetical protein [Candidatus Micrarchaeota archaeon]